MNDASTLPAAPAGFGQLLLLVLVCLLCLELRLDALRLTDLEPPRVRADSAEYYFYTLNLRQYGIYSRHDSRREGPPREADFLRWPGMSLLALPFAGDADTLVPRFLLAQTLASAAAGLLVYGLAAAMAGYWAGLFALLLYATSPHLINANLYFLTESPMSCLLIGFAYALYRATLTTTRRWWIAAGLLLGLATLTRPFIEPTAALLIAALWVSAHPERLRAAVWMGLPFLAVVLPWHLLVWLCEPPGATSLFASSVQHGMYPGFMYEGRPETFGLPYRSDPATPRIAGNLPAVLAELAQRVREHPARYLWWYLAGKPLMLWQWTEVQGTRAIFIYPPLRTPFDFLPQFEAARTLGAALHYPALLLAFAGAAVAWIRRLHVRIDEGTRMFLRLAGVLFLWTTLMHMIGAPLPRYHMPLKPLVFVCATVSATLLLKQLLGCRRAAAARST